jgi:O-antigen/teichoic acid export membrane protein
MSQPQRNLIANFVGRGWAALMGIAFIPLYIKFMGIESYGLVGFFTTLQAVFVLLDLGLTTTLNREIARYSALAEKSQDMRDLVRTLETIYWGLAFSIGAIVLMLSPFIAREWVKADALSVEVIQKSVMLMGLVMAFQWPLGFYSGGLLGLQRQVLFNILNAIWYTLRFAGGVLVLWLVSPTILAFFAWQVVVSAVSTGLVAIALWRSLPAGHERARFRISIWWSVWRFAAGMSGIGVTVLVLTQLDKIILSKMLPLELFGYYTLAWTVANGLTTLTSAVFTVLFPVFSQRVAVEDMEGLKHLYHRSCQLMSVLILPVAILVALFAREILAIWIQNPVTVTNTHLLVSLLIIGTALNGLMNLPYALQLAHGWTSLAFYTNVVSVIILIPLLVVAISYYGVTGAAAIWIALNSGYVLISLQIMHQRLLKGEQWRWYIYDVGLPLVTALGVVGIGRLLIHDQMTLPMVILSLMITYTMALVFAMLAASQLRVLFWRKIGTWTQELIGKTGKVI